MNLERHLARRRAMEQCSELARRFRYQPGCVMSQPASYEEWLAYFRQWGFLYLVPTLTMERKLTRALAAEADLRVHGRLPVFSVMSLVYWSRGLFQAGSRVDVGLGGVTLLLRDLLERYQPASDLRPLARHQRSVQALQATIQELSRAGVTPPAFAGAVQQLDDQHTSSYLPALAAVYERVTSTAQQQGHLPHYRAFEALAAAFDQARDLMDMLVVDAFVDYTRPQRHLIEAASRCSRRVQLISGVRSLEGFDAGPNQYQASLPAGFADVSSGHVPAVRLTSATVQEAPSVASEVQHLVQSIKSLLTSGTPAAEIAVAVHRLDVYWEPLASRLDAAGVPWQQVGPNQDQHPGPCAALLQAAWEFSLGASAENLHFLLQAGSKGESQWWPSGQQLWPWLASLQRYAYLEGESLLANLAPGLRRLARQLQAPFEREMTVAAFAAVSWELVQELQPLVDATGEATARWQPVQQALRDWRKQANAQGLADRQWPLSVLVEEAAQVLNRLEQPGPRQAGVTLVDTSEIRGLRFQQVFIPGLAEGLFPRQFHQDWLVPDPLRHELAKEGLELQDTAQQRGRELLLFTQAVAAAARAVHLSYPLEVDGGEQLPSSWLQSLASAWSLEVEQVPRTAAVDALSSRPVTTAGRLAALLADQGEASGQGSLPGQEPGRLALLGRRLELIAGRHGPGFSRFDGRVTSADILARMKQRAARPWPVSAFNTYAMCGWQYLGRYWLELGDTPQGEAELAPLDRGVLAHRILARYFQQLDWEQFTSSSDYAYQLMLSLCEEAFNAYRQRKQGETPPAEMESGLYRLRQVLLSIVDKEQQRAAANGGRLRPALFELAFGRQHKPGDAQPAAAASEEPAGSSAHAAPAPARAGIRSTPDLLVLETAAGRLQFAGQIDRVDLAPEGYLVLDYKLSSTPDLEALTAGYEFQVPLYMMAFEQLFVPQAEAGQQWQPIGGGYYSLARSSYSRGLWRKRFGRKGEPNLTDLTNRTAGMVEDEEFERLVAALPQRAGRQLARFLEGDLRPLPADEAACDSCELSTVCRFNSKRLGLKDGGRPEVGR